MFRASFPHGAPRRLIAAFVLVLLLPAAAVVWLGVRLINQDQQLEAEQRRKQRESAVGDVVAALNDQLTTEEQTLGSTAPPGDDAVRVVLGERGVELHPPIRLLYQPGFRTGFDDVRKEFAAGEELEYGRADLTAAEAAFRTLASGRSSAIRAGALIRLARVLKKAGKREAALRVYDDLARLPGERVDGVPADLAARRARCRLLAELGQSARLRVEAASLRTDLFAGRWEIDRGTFEQYSGELSDWLGFAVTAPATQLALTEAAGWLWERRGTDGRRAITFAGIDLVLLWKSSAGDTTALVAGPEFQKRRWFSTSRTGSEDDGLQVALATGDHVVSGEVRGDGSAEFRRDASSTGLPWDVVVTSSGASSIGSNRRLAILIGLGFLVLLVVAGGYVIARAVSRELAVARLQSDFVASVSHEFRTPLTSLRQFTDLLNEGDDVPAEKRQLFYAAQSRATERLQRLVESLLDFKRMEAGTHPYRRQQIPASTLVQRVVDEFRPEAAGRGVDVELAPADGDRAIDADADALSLALWNLLDNAVKYSGNSRRVVVSTAAQNGSVAISVRDHGLGVPPDEQREIFRQFVRGREARSRGIKGTGIGLAMVQHIVQGHGGRVAVESAPGQGSTFTIVLPAVEGPPEGGHYE